jgi:hypothetical protein
MFQRNMLFSCFWLKCHYFDPEDGANIYTQDVYHAARLHGVTTLVH